VTAGKWSEVYERGIVRDVLICLS